jgi:hypothetical protein
MMCTTHEQGFIEAFGPPLAEHPDFRRVPLGFRVTRDRRRDDEEVRLRTRGLQAFPPARTTARTHR